MCKPLDLNDNDHKSLLNRILKGEVSLFLGSGFSFGATSSFKDEEAGNRIPIPSVNALKGLLCNNILYSGDVNDTLQEICEECQEDNPSKYQELMRRIFKTTAIADYHRKYAEIDWKSIFTINVDDVIENAYSDSKELCCVYSETPVYQSHNALCYYKLHGCAVKSPESITFSTTDYISNASSRNDWRFESLTAALKTDNFLFIGTTLSDEWDFDIKCKQSDIYAVTNKTYFVLKDYNEKLLKKLKRKFTNPVFIQETAQSFIEKVIEYKETLSHKVKLSYARWNLREVKKEDYDVTGYLKPDLYLGSEPTWEDIFSKHDVIWEKTRNAIQTVDNEQYVCIMIVGKPISGKTTMAYRLGAFLADNFTVLEYTGINFFEEITRFADSRNVVANDETIFILVDDANWILGRFESILQLVETKHIRLIITIREKEYEKRQHLFDKNILSKVKVISNISRLTDADLGSYLDKLNEKSFLGRYSKSYTDSRQRAINELAQDLKAAKGDRLLNLTYSLLPDKKNLSKRLEEIGDKIANNQNYNVKRFAVLLYLLDVVGDTGVKLSLFLGLYPMSNLELKSFFSEIQELMISNVSSHTWKESSYDKIIIHARFSEILKKSIKKIDYQELLELVEDIFRRLDVTEHYKCRQSNSYHNYVLYTLLRSQNIEQLFGFSEDKKRWKYISKLYEDLHDYYEDYHLYWLHRGISEVKMRKFEAARIHLEQARVTRRSYSYEIEHTFAILNYDQAIYSKDCSIEDRLLLLEEAQRIIRTQINKEENDAFTIHSFVVKNIRFYESIKQTIPDNLMNEMLKNYYIARDRFELSGSRIRRNMLVSIYNYLKTHDKLYKGYFSTTQEELTYLRTRLGENNINDQVLDLL